MFDKTESHLPIPHGPLPLAVNVSAAGEAPTAGAWWTCVFGNFCWKGTWLKSCWWFQKSGLHVELSWWLVVYTVIYKVFTSQMVVGDFWTIHSNNSQKSCHVVSFSSGRLKKCLIVIAEKLAEAVLQLSGLHWENWGLAFWSQVVRVGEARKWTWLIYHALKPTTICIICCCCCWNFLFKHFANYIYIYLYKPNPGVTWKNQSCCCFFLSKALFWIWFGVRWCHFSESNGTSTSWPRFGRWKCVVLVVC